MQILDYETYIQNYIWLPIAAFILLFISLVLFEYQKKSIFSILGLVLGAFALYSFMALADPFLHDWDEQYHALVAKNLMQHFWTPSLLEDPILPHTEIGNDWWINTHIWLHKQPFFLWQMAMSMKIFGVNIFAMRLPSLLMASIIPVFIYRTGSIIKNKSLGFYAALLFVSSHFILKLVSGRLNTDHNDMAFIFYITASLWSWFEYQHSKKTYWLILIGLLSGIAVLVKWLMGLLVYAAWGLVIISNSEKRKKISSYIDIVKAFAVSMIVALPWQIYILFRFPEISRFEYAYNSKHLWKAVEGHGGDWLYHFHEMDYLYAPWFNYFIIASLIAFLFVEIEKKYKIAIVSWIVIVFGFYSYAATKMPTFTTIISSLLFLVIVAPWIHYSERFIKNINILKITRISLAVAAFYWLFSLDEIQNKPNWKRDYWKQNYSERLVFQRINQANLSDNSYFYNFYHFGAVRFMFHTNYQARKFLPTAKDITILKKANAAIYIFDDGKLPKYILSDTSITKIKSPIWPDMQIEDLEFYR
jgi:4-amino-4-deoxy-L-arabinose transferase